MPCNRPPHQTDLNKQALLPYVGQEANTEIVIIIFFYTSCVLHLTFCGIRFDIWFYDSMTHHDSI